jgi:hypothetical protein
MPYITRLRFAAGKTRFRFSPPRVGRERKLKLRRKELLEVAILLLILVVVVVLAMYLGWWTLQQEEHGGVSSARSMWLMQYSNSSGA